MVIFGDLKKKNPVLGNFKIKRREFAAEYSF